MAAQQQAAANPPKPLPSSAPTVPAAPYTATVGQFRRGVYTT